MWGVWLFGIVDADHPYPTHSRLLSPERRPLRRAGPDGRVRVLGRRKLVRVYQQRSAYRGRAQERGRATVPLWHQSNAQGLHGRADWRPSEQGL